MAAFLKPDNLNIVWASGGDRLYPGDTKYQSGWGVEIPPRQYFNEIDYKQDQMLAHINQRGIAEWDADTEYQANKSYTQDSTGTIHRCILTHFGQNPELDISNTYWEIAFANSGDFFTQTESDARYAQLSNNGSDYTPSIFRTNLSVYSKAETYSRSEVDSKTTVASTAQALAGTSNTTLMTPLRLRDAVAATGNAPIFAARAWAMYDGGTNSLLGAGNVASIDKLATGVFQVTFTAPMTNANYAPICNGSETLAGMNTNQDTVGYYDRQTTGFKIQCYASETGQADFRNISFVVFAN